MTCQKLRKIFAKTAATMNIPDIITMTSGRILKTDSVDSSKNLNSPAEEGGRGASRRLLFSLLNALFSPCQITFEPTGASLVVVNHKGLPSASAANNIP